MYKFSPGLGTPLKYNPCDGKVSIESIVNDPSSPTNVKSNSALFANENAAAAITVVTFAFSVKDVSLSILNINTI